MMRIAEKVLTQVIFILYGYSFYYLIRKQKKKTYLIYPIKYVKIVHNCINENRQIKRKNKLLKMYLFF